MHEMVIVLTNTDPRATTRDLAWAVASTVMDPEIPVVSIADLGILRDLQLDDHGAVIATITPTYSGCPAMDAIKDDLETAFKDAGFTAATVRLVLAPAWTTDWITEAGRKTLSDYGIAPPAGRVTEVPLTLSVRCPHCGSLSTEELSQFGSTACKALWRCRDCAEPFDYFKVL